MRPDDPGPGGGGGGSPGGGGGPDGPGPGDDDDLDHDFGSAHLAEDIVARVHAAARAARNTGGEWRGGGAAGGNVLSDVGDHHGAQFQQLRDSTGSATSQYEPHQAPARVPTFGVGIRTEASSPGSGMTSRTRNRSTPP